MDKRGQVYILAAILLAVAIYSLSTVVNIVQQEEIQGDFETLSRNYEIESSRFINSVLQSGGNVPDSFANFTFLFTSYSKAKSPSFNLFYALAYEDKIHFGNFMNEDVIVYIPCPEEDSCEASVEEEILGCLGNISAQMSFEGLTISSEFLAGEFEILRDKCFESVSVDSNIEYCISIGGMMYNLSIMPNVPKIFSLSRLESGAQVLHSAQGEIGEEQVCEGRSESKCCEEFCCWDEEQSVCLEGRCPKRPGTVCGDGICELGETCGNCEEDCCCFDGTRVGKCSGNKPLFCNEGKELVDNCDKCRCPSISDQNCLPSGSCCVKEGRSCDGSIPCCDDMYYYCDGICKPFREDCEDTVDNDGDTEIDCDDPDCEEFCSATKPKRCVGGAWVDDCGECGCPSPADQNCLPSGSCCMNEGMSCVEDSDCCPDHFCDAGICKATIVEAIPVYETLTCRRSYTAYECDGTPTCNLGWIQGDPWIDCTDCCGCVWWWCDDRYARDCYQDYTTICTMSPSCLSNETQQGSPSPCYTPQCLDGTFYGSCSDVIKGKYCDDTGSLVDGCETYGCSCDSIYDCVGNVCVIKTCSDGTPYNQCSMVNRGKWCNSYGNLVWACDTHDCDCGESWLFCWNNKCWISW